MNRDALVAAIRRSISDGSIYAFILLLPAFFLRVFISTTGDNYSEFPGFGLTFLGYVSHCFIVIAFLYKYYEKYAGAIFTIVLLALILSLSQAWLASGQGDYTAENVAFPVLRGWLWAFSVLAVYVIVKDERSFVAMYELLAKFTCVVIILAAIFHAVTGIPFLVLFADEVPRAQGFLSEPSGVSYVAPIVIALAVVRRDWLWLIVGFAAAYLSKSVTAIAVAGVALIISALLLFHFRRTVALLTVAVCVLCVCVPILLGSDVGQPLMLAAAEFAKAHVDDYASGASVFDALVTRVLSAIIDLPSIISSYSHDNAGGSLARLIGIFLMYDSLQDSGALATGFGLNAYGALVVHAHGETAAIDFGLPSYLVSSFGAPLGIALCFAIILRLAHVARLDVRLYVLYSVSFISVLLNSAGGLHSYTVSVYCLIGALSALTTRKTSATGLSE